MPIQYEVFTNCPATGKLVPTGSIMKTDKFPDDKSLYPGGTYNCPACKQPHAWHRDSAKIYPGTLSQ